MNKTVITAAAVSVVVVILLAQLPATRDLVNGGNRFFR